MRGKVIQLDGYMNISKWFANDVKYKSLTIMGSYYANDLETISKLENIIELKLFDMNVLTLHKIRNISNLKRIHFDFLSFDNYDVYKELCLFNWDLTHITIKNIGIYPTQDVIDSLLLKFPNLISLIVEEFTVIGRKSTQTQVFFENIKCVLPDNIINSCKDTITLLEFVCSKYELNFFDEFIKTVYKFNCQNLEFLTIRCECMNVSISQTNLDLIFSKFHKIKYIRLIDIETDTDITINGNNNLIFFCLKSMRPRNIIFNNCKNLNSLILSVTSNILPDITKLNNLESFLMDDIKNSRSNIIDVDIKKLKAIQLKKLRICNILEIIK